MKEKKYHEPVLVREVLSQLGAHLKDKKVIDATLGTGGHALEIIKCGAEVLGIEADQSMLNIAKERLDGKGLCKIVHGNFRNIDRIAKESEFEDIDGILFDLGVSNLQLTSDVRGFSFSYPKADLDLRIDPESQGVKGSDLLNGLRPDQLAEMFKQVLDVSSSRWLAKRVVAKREESKIETVADFLALCQGLRSKPGLHPATLPFLALRIAVNTELDNLKEALPKALELLKVGGKLLVITFHSKEEEIVRNFSEDFVGPIKPSQEEIDKNPRSRSAELFVLTKKC